MYMDKVYDPPTLPKDTYVGNPPNLPKGTIVGDPPTFLYDKNFGGLATLPW